MRKRGVKPSKDTEPALAGDSAGTCRGSQGNDADAWFRIKSVFAGRGSVASFAGSETIRICLIFSNSTGLIRLG